MTQVKESKKRSLLKALSYRIICIISMLLITFLFTNNVNQSIYITIVFQSIQTVLYYLTKGYGQKFQLQVNIYYYTTLNNKF